MIAGEAPINGRPVFVNHEKNRFMAWNGEVWEVTSMDYLDGLHTHYEQHGYFPGVFGGFAAGGSAAGPQGTWKDFYVAPWKVRGPARVAGVMH